MQREWPGNLIFSGKYQSIGTCIGKEPSMAGKPAKLG
jgi:hypothetical protein